MVKYLPMTESRVKYIKLHTRDEESLQVLETTVLHGWPIKREDTPSLAKPYFYFRDEITVQDGILFRSEREIIPRTLRMDMMQKIHSSHFGLGESTKPKTVIRKLRALFARYGIPDTMISDKGPQVSCNEFAKFATEWEFDHKTSSPGYSQRNGKAEQAVKSAKRLMKRARKDNKDNLHFRNTPTERNV
ncbi:unnamed protein product [Mytilus coruscus]|uniref:Integrase catalytic domain-containing protein n=1 Tax=Mytilus coruscus TaxID=42192 RepID=A0A6J8BXS6_MYTCO|nr:unnamed protein product [Mytilus coruscus]